MKTEDLAKVQEMLAEERTMTEIAKSLGLIPSTLNYKLKDAGYRIVRGPARLEPIQPVALPTPKEVTPA